MSRRGFLTRRFQSRFAIREPREKIAPASAGVQHWVFDGEVAAGSEAQGHVGYHYEIVNGLEVTVIKGNIRSRAAVETTQDFPVELQGHVVLTANDFIFGGG